ncbi:MAG: hypothetical protein WCO33_03655 [bacterium]
MRSQLYKQVTDTLNNKGWGDMKYYQDPLASGDSLGIFVKQNGDVKKIGFPMYMNFKAHSELETKRIVIVGSIVAFLIVFLVIIITIVSLVS